MHSPQTHLMQVFNTSANFSQITKLWLGERFLIVFVSKRCNTSTKWPVTNTNVLFAPVSRRVNTSFLGSVSQQTRAFLTDRRRCTEEEKWLSFCVGILSRNGGWLIPPAAGISRVLSSRTALARILDWSGFAQRKLGKLQFPPTSRLFFSRSSI